MRKTTVTSGGGTDGNPRSDSWSVTRHSNSTIQIMRAYLEPAIARYQTPHLESAHPIAKSRLFTTSIHIVASAPIPQSAFLQSRRLRTHAHRSTPPFALRFTRHFPHHDPDGNATVTERRSRP